MSMEEGMKVILSDIGIRRLHAIADLRTGWPFDESEIGVVLRTTQYGAVEVRWPSGDHGWLDVKELEQFVPRDNFQQTRLANRRIKHYGAKF